MSTESQPAPTQDREAARSFYDRISRAYDLLADKDEHVARERGLALLAVEAGEAVLEIGFGTGKSLLELAFSVGASGSLSGIDISTGMREVAEKRLAKQNPPAPLDLRVAAAPPLPWPDDSFDAISISFTLELFPEADIPALLEEIRRVLRPSGRLAIACMASVAPGEKESLLERSYQWMHRHFPHVVDCRPIDAAALLTPAGFSVETVETFTIWTLPVAVLLVRNSGGE